MDFGAGHAALASVRERELAAVRQRFGRSFWAAFVNWRKLGRDPSLRFVARDDDPDRIGELATLGQWVGRSFRADVVDARKLLMVFVNAAKLILLVDVRGGETFARRVRREIGVI